MAKAAVNVNDMRADCRARASCHHAWGSEARRQFKLQIRACQKRLEADQNKKLTETCFKEPGKAGLFRLGVHACASTPGRKHSVGNSRGTLIPIPPGLCRNTI